MPMEEEVIQLFSGKYKYLKTIPVDQVQEYEAGLILEMKTKHPEILAEIREKKELSDELIVKIKAALDAYTQEYKVKAGL
jgi:F-type H+-transporting ATPase subunit alpha